MPNSDKIKIISATFNKPSDKNIVFKRENSNYSSIVDFRVDGIGILYNAKEFKDSMSYDDLLNETRKRVDIIKNQQEKRNKELNNANSKNRKIIMNIISLFFILTIILVVINKTYRANKK